MRMIMKTHSTGASSITVGFVTGILFAGEGVSSTKRSGAEESSWTNDSSVTAPGDLNYILEHTHTQRIDNPYHQ